MQHSRVRSVSLKKDVPTAFNLEASNKTAETTSRPSSVEVVDKCRDDGNSRNINTKRSESSADKNYKKNGMPTDFDDFTGHNKHFSPNAKIDNFSERDEKQNSNKNTFKSQTNEKRPKLFSFQKISPSDKKALFNGQKESRIDEHAFLKSKPVSQGSSSIQSTVEIGGARLKTKSNLQLQNYAKGPCQRKQSETADITPAVIEMAFLKDLMYKESSIIVDELLNNRQFLDYYIDMATKDENAIDLFLQVLSKAFETHDLKIILQLFEYLKTKGLFDKIIDCLLHVIIQIKTKETAGTYIQRILENILIIQIAHLTRNPSSYRTFRKLQAVICQVIEELANIGSCNDEVYAKYERLSEYMRAIEKDRKQTFKSEEKREPPDDFRHYPTSPTIDEITSVTKPFLRPVKVTGSYENLHDYLDVHFRLLREDFVGPLRDGITGLIKIMSAYKGKATTSERLKELDMKIYENVRVLSPVVTQQGLCYKMKLQMTPNLRNIEWKFSKRLIYGSMVCLTDKDFTEFFLATVVEREDKDIRRGYFVVHFETQNIDMKKLHRKMFIMAETSGYFEAYRHVLSSLKTCKDGDLPFEKYIVNCKESIGYPAYLNQNHKYDLRPLVDQDVKLKAKRRLIKNKVLAVSNDIEFSLQSYPAGEVHLTRLRNWPNKELLRMDGSQYRAVQSALTRELAIIQGPPGTGKTYIGLQIVKTLLHNKSVWTETGQSIKPMLIVCYTNHALDQFLEGILKFYKGDILRVGGRSNSADLEEYNLKEYRQIKFKKNSSLATLQFNKRVSRRNMDAQSRCVQNLAKRIQLFQSEIVNEDTLSKEIGDRLFKSLKADFKGNVKQANFSYIVKWLGVEYMKKECVKELRKARNVRKVKHVRVEDEIARTLQERMLDFDADTNFSSIEGLIVRKIRNDDIAFYVEESKGKTRRRKNEPSKEQELDKLFNKTFKTTLMAKITDEDVMSQEEADTIQNVWRLNHKTKWRLYRLWIKKKCTALYEKIEEEKANFEATSESYRDALQQVDKAIMQKAVVIGMTTSGAARYQSVLREIGPKIIVVEEAAEVLEAHIITTLSNKCEHLILIGDHKQLRPNPTVYELVVKYNFDISLFERMVKNGIEFNCLELQHRMRPEISSIMRHIYPDLKDHEHVRSYPNVKGVSTNLFLVNHSHMEICSNEIKSYSNPKEAEYAVALCRYLLLQGYKKDEITILTTYSGQLMYFRNLMSEEEFDGVHVTVVDNYQGEENQIVILSLVRSNKNAKIGFLKTENRICVALSRAKVGLFIIANFDHLSSHSSLWERITVDMKNKNHFGEGLVLYCQNHPNDDPIVAIKAEDFQKAPEGGCFKKCDTRLKCGHKCVLYCHVIDKEHNEIKCKKPCTKILCDLGHKCPDKCFIECSPCQVLVTKIIPECGHTQLVPCATKPEDYCCQETCSKFLECSHMCKEKCGEEHTTECHEKVQFIWPCGHSYEIKCLETKTKACPQPCGLQLKCKHTCSGTCASCFNGRMHQQCRHGCSVTHPCGHKSSALCQHNPLCSEPCENRCSHKKCRKKCGEVCTPCMLPCSWKCIHKRCTRRCGEICNRNACNFPCGKNLKCNHKCIGLCGEPCPSICRHCNYIKFKAMTFGKKQKQNAHYVLLEQCGHLIEYQAMDTMVKKQTKSKEIRCPKCTTIIKHCLRYGNIIKTFLSTIESSKKIAIGNLHLRYRLSGSITDIPEESESDSRIYAEIKQGTISEDVARTKYTSHFYKLFCKKELGKRLDSLTGVLITERQLLTIEKQWKICINVSNLIQRINDTEHDLRDSEKGNNFVSFLHKLITIVVQPRSVLTDQENEDIDREIRRGKTYLKFLKIDMSAIPMSVAAKIRENFIAIETVLLGSTLYTDELDSNVNKSIGCLSAEIEMYNQ
ncbi:NFX1-type zinc finger-containing protein 1-like [Ruditapes philippinarum]|uniref:NFX1-type zinc finger-containing protein 1-like n=1 Tax=Ruditapes philippinarum TaxID=129788 RepID=UPI00295AB4AB|nr:NFX1-type zinc finger-containing protein 1-like [Ruditapes philippinarum]